MSPQFSSEIQNKNVVDQTENKLILPYKNKRHLTPQKKNNIRDDEFLLNLMNYWIEYFDVTIFISNKKNTAQ